MSTSFIDDNSKNMFDETQSSAMETSLWDDVPSTIPTSFTPPKHESTPVRRTYPRRAKSASCRKVSDENTPVNNAPRKTRKAATCFKSRSKSQMKPVNLWDKALKKNKELAKFIESYNEQMEKICSTELSIRSDPNSSMMSISFYDMDSINSPGEESP